MFVKLMTKLFGSRNDRLLKKMQKEVNKINALEPILEALSDEELKAKTAEFKERLAQAETIDLILPEAFAVVREASKRVFGMRHFDVQMFGGMVLNDGKISEMRTGEGKTLTATLPAYLNALTGEGVHIITVVSVHSNYHICCFCCTVVCVVCVVCVACRLAASRDVLPTHS